MAAEAPSSPRSPRRRLNHELAAMAILGSAASWALAPLIIHLTAREANPFLFNFVAHVTMSLAFIILVLLTKGRLLMRHLPDSQEDSNDEGKFRLFDRATYFLRFKVVTPEAPDDEPIVSVISEPKPRPIHWLKFPILWATLSSLQVGFLAWSTQYVETAISAVVYELWPIFTVYGLSYHDYVDAKFRNRGSDNTKRNQLFSTEQLVLSGLAAIGVLFMLGSQAGDAIDSASDLFTLNALAGILLALMSSILAGLSLVASLVYGKALYYRIIGESDAEDKRDPRPVAERGREHSEILLWTTMLGVAIARFASLPLSLGLGLLLGGSEGGFQTTAAIGALLYAAVAVSSNLLARLGNLGDTGPGVNALFFCAPAFAVLILMTVGISLPRFDLYIVGAALIVAINILIQSKPDRLRDPVPFGKAGTPNARLGFTAFILGIWIFGTILYTRDEIFPNSWLAWGAGEYWGLIALSATVFALILGFRVARLTTRIGREDEIMLSLFRDCEHLVDRGLEDDVLNLLLDLDTARPGELLSTYNSIRIRIRGALDATDDNEVKRLLYSAQKQLDTLVHNKQQGRDIVELLSLTAFAVVTIGLGIAARPVGGSDAGQWNVFLSEVFVLMFVSTIAFLCINLFDIRRERESPLLVFIRSKNLGHVIFFRHDSNLLVQYITAIVISVAMTTVFCALLYFKWLG